MTMNKAFKELFGPIRAEESLKERTRAFLAEKGYGAGGGRRRPLRAAACACVLLLLGGHWLYFTPTAEISIDINPSVELSVNRFDRVISVNGFNEDGWELSRGLDVKYKHYTEAMDQILNDDGIAALLSGGGVVIITVIGPDGRQSSKILSEVETCTAERSNAYCYFALPEEAAAAHETGLSCGKYKAFLELQRLDPTVTPEDVRGMTMRELQERINNLSPDGGSGPAAYAGWEKGSHGHGGGHGNGWRGGAGQQGAGE